MGHLNHSMLKASLQAYRPDIEDGVRPVLAELISIVLDQVYHLWPHNGLSGQFVYYPHVATH